MLTTYSSRLTAKATRTPNGAPNSRKVSPTTNGEVLLRHHPRILKIKQKRSHGQTGRWRGSWQDLECQGSFLEIENLWTQQQITLILPKLLMLLVLKKFLTIFNNPISRIAMSNAIFFNQIQNWFRKGTHPRTLPLSLLHYRTCPSQIVVDAILARLKAETLNFYKLGDSSMNVYNERPI